MGLVQQPGSCVALLVRSDVPAFVNQPINQYSQSRRVIFDHLCTLSMVKCFLFSDINVLTVMCLKQYLCAFTSYCMANHR